jgi:ribonuclease Z
MGVGGKKGFIVVAALAIAAIGYLAGFVDGSSEDGSALVGAAEAQDESGMAWSPTDRHPMHTVYYPGTEPLAPDEMRVVACGTGMPQPRLSQSAACFLVELGNGDKFIFDMGEGSFERLMALGIPLDHLNKVFLGHLHLDHAGDFPALFLLGPVNNRLTKVRLWGPAGVQPGWGTKDWAQHMKEMWAWESATRGAAVDPRGLQLEVKTLPAIHGTQAVSFILEWNGLKFAFSSDTLPTRWYREHAAGADLSIHECFVPPDFMMEKYGFAASEAIFVGSQGHTAAQAFGKIMAQTEPRQAVCYHFQNDHDTAPAVLEAIRETYDGPIDLAEDFMTWNVTKESVRTRMGVPNHDAYPAPPQMPKNPPDSAAEFPFGDFDLQSMEIESARATNEMIKAFNERQGTNIKGAYTSQPFEND